MATNPPSITSTANLISWYEQWERVYPCRCGETHRGPRAAEDYYMHTCDHEEVLAMRQEAPDRLWGLCGACGKPMWVTLRLVEDSGGRQI